ncbi:MULTISPECIES: mycothione reductase [unclassified Corynebacterium]|uniref:mycothione reductase n=1 Tax=unclassified Corynebacterium TaxID=2624378 RepID=UPI002652EFA2|nr:MULTISPECIES: mycothione reductase [unclassified Corynebacterium]MDN8593717.1 mycothione reductase [Corynebacterium sp. P4_F2]WKK55832.1 mycothione reductase [Corynebacterium sp. P4-C1]WKK63240.1 mycothione reductase [Corynebacterium sp. P8-C1]
MHFDYIIIGSGSGNSFPTPELDDASIAIIDEAPRFGGTCLNSGCIPTKMYVVAADTAHSAASSERLGIRTTFDGADWPAIVDRVFSNRIDLISRGGEDYRRGDECPNVTLFRGHAEFTGPKTLSATLDGEPVEITGDTIIIAAGSRPNIPPVIAESGVPFLTNEDVMRLPEQPESITILGGGFIAMEFAHVFESLGTHVRLVNRSPLLRHLDDDIHERFNAIAQSRYETHIGRTVASATHDEHSVTLTLDDGTSLTSSALLVATGRLPNGDRLNLAAAGVRMHENSRIVVDDYGRTTTDSVWALGDVSSPHMLKHVANAELRAVRHNILNPSDMVPMPHEHVPSAVFTYPQLATVGMTEAQARDAGFDVTTKIQNYGDVAYGWALEDQTGVVKLIADKKTGKLLGAHYMGPQASTLIQQMITVMAFDLDLREVARGQYWIHPALPEVTENAILGLDLDFPDM